MHGTRLERVVNVSRKKLILIVIILSTVVPIEIIMFLKILTIPKLNVKSQENRSKIAKKLP